MLLLSIFSIGAIIFEVPSGMFADFFGRKLSISIGMLISSLSYIWIASSSSFISFASAYSIMAIGWALISGADSALLYDSLKMIKKEDLFKKISGRAHTSSNFGFLLGSLVGGFISRFGFRTNYYFFSLSIFLGFLVSLFLVEPKSYKKIVGKDYYKHLMQSLKFSFTHKRLKLLIIFNGIMLASLFTLFTLFQPYMIKMGINVSYFGYFYMLFLLSAAVISFFAHNIEKKIGERASFVVIPLLICLPVIFMGKFLFIYSLVFMVLMEFAYGYIGPVISHYTHKHIESFRRATVMSISTLFMRLCWAVFAPFLGLLSDHYSVEAAYLTYGILLIPVAIIILIPLFKTTNKFNNA